MSRSIRLIAVLMAIAAICFGQSVKAQTDRGTIAGHVTDPPGSVLQGAQITLAPTGTTAATDQFGDYFIKNLAPGSYTVTITYVGFGAFAQTVTVKAGQTTALEAKMQVASQREQVLVTEHFTGEAEGVNRERTADNILQVMTSEVSLRCPRFAGQVYAGTGNRDQSRRKNDGFRREDWESIRSDE